MTVRWFTDGVRGFGMMIIIITIIIDWLLDITKEIHTSGNYPCSAAPTSLESIDQIN